MKYSTEDVKVEVTGVGPAKRWKLSCGDIRVEFNPFSSSRINIIHIGTEDVFSSYVDWPSRMRKRKDATPHRYWEAIPSEEYIGLIRPLVAAIACKGSDVRERALTLARVTAGEAVDRLTNELNYWHARASALDKLLEDR